jgi:hypothetical protein
MFKYTVKNHKARSDKSRTRLFYQYSFYQHKIVA